MHKGLDEILDGHWQQTRFELKRSMNVYVEREKQSVLASLLVRLSSLDDGTVSGARRLSEAIDVELDMLRSLNANHK